MVTHLSTTRGQDDRINHRRAVPGQKPHHYSGKTKSGISLLKYKERKDKKFQTNARLMREYKRAMKAEGYKPIKSITQETQKLKDNETKDDNDKSEIITRTRQSTYDENMAVQLEAKAENKKKRKPDPFALAKKQAEEKKKQRELILKQKEEQQKLKQKKEKERRLRRRELSRRTRKGQPIMGNVITHILGKLEKAETNQKEEE